MASIIECGLLRLTTSAWRQSLCGKKVPIVLESLSVQLARRQIAMDPDRKELSDLIEFLASPRDEASWLLDEISLLNY